MNLSYIALFTYLTFYPTNENSIGDLFLNWNRATLNSLKQSCEKTKNESDLLLCEDRLKSLPYIWMIQNDSLNNNSIRWKFLKTIEKDSIFLNKKWGLIEVMKSGERVRLINHVITYQKEYATILVYTYQQGEWVKINSTKNNCKNPDIDISPKTGTLRTNGYPHDFIITHFTHQSVINSNYFLEYTIDKSEEVIQCIENIQK